jgi:hypothetical protein
MLGDGFLVGSHRRVEGTHLVRDHVDRRLVLASQRLTTPASTQKTGVVDPHRDEEVGLLNNRFTMTTMM